MVTLSKERKRKEGTRKKLHAPSETCSFFVERFYYLTTFFPLIT